MISGASKKDGITLSQMFENPSLIDEDLASEFVRMFYVACSRARNELIVHVSDKSLTKIIDDSLSQFIENTGQTIKYEFIE